MSKKKPPSLCFRCEHRARFLDGGVGPRDQCKQPMLGVCSCYMFLPTIPPIIKVERGDKRPVFGSWIMSARVNPLGLPEVDLKGMRLKRGAVVYVVPKKDKKAKR